MLLHLSVFKLQRDSSYHKPFNSLTSVLAHLTHRTPPEKKTGVVYDIICENSAVAEEVLRSFFLKGQSTSNQKLLPIF